MRLLYKTFLPSRYNKQKRNYQDVLIKGVRDRYKKKNKKQLQHTKLFPFETSHPPISELNEVASENIPVYKDIDLN